jgi:hypothetical protein
MKPITKKEGALRFRFKNPHDTWNNHDQAVRIARRRWKRKLHHHQRTQGKDEIKSQQECAAAIVSRLLEDGEPERYLKQLPQVYACPDCDGTMRNPLPDEAEYVSDYLRSNRTLIPSAQAADVRICDDCASMYLQQTLATWEAGGLCPRCEGTGEEPGAPVELDGSVALCAVCHGKGKKT